MAKFAIVTGLVLILIAAAGYGLSKPKMVDAKGQAVSGDTKDATDDSTSTDNSTGELKSKGRSLTGLIPAVFGLPILLCGIWGTVKPHANKHAMHVAVTVALVGALAGSLRGVMSLLSWIKGEDFNSRALLFTALLGVICWIFVIACVKSFIAARKAREAAAQ